MLVINAFIWMYHNLDDRSMKKVHPPVMFFSELVQTPPTLPPKKHGFVDSISDSAGMKKVSIQPAGRQKRETLCK